MSGPPLCVLLLPRELEGFILRDQAEDLLRAPGVVAIEPARAVPAGALGRLPPFAGDLLAATQASRMELPGEPRVVVIFHPLQMPLARALLTKHREAELWYGRWDRYEAAYDASPRLRRRIAALHAEAAERAALVFAASDALARVESDAGRAAVAVGLSADAFPAPDPAATVVALSLGHLGRRTDWALLHGLTERMPELVLLLVGTVHEDEAGGSPDFRALRAAPNVVWLGRRSDDEAARLLLLADAGLVPFLVEPFNDAALPYRILKAARLGRRTLTPVLEGVLTWERAVHRCATLDEWVAALRAQAGRRTSPDLELREWALAQTARTVNAPLWARLEALGIESGRLGSVKLAAARDHT